MDDKTETKAAPMKTEGGEQHPANHYLVVEDSASPSTWHLRVLGADGKPDHRLMGAAWAALHGGYRGNKYEGPSKADAIAKLKKLYESEQMALPAEKQTQSLDQMSTRIREEFMEEYGNTGMYVLDIYPEFAIVGDGTDSYKVPYASVNGDIEFSDFPNWVAVERDWVMAESGVKEVKENFLSRIVKQVLQSFKAGARHSAKDIGDIQSIHDLATGLGAECAGNMSVIKQADGKLRWVMFSSTAYQDRDGEIVSQKALADDVARADATGEYGPLDWWHIDGLNLGQCDFNAVDGKVLIESGTFVNEAVGEAVKAASDKLGGSIAFYHPANEPQDGVYKSIRRFARAVLPRNKASNLFTSLTVKESDMNMAQEKFDALKELVGDSLAQELVRQSEAVQKAADKAGVKFKEKQDAPPEPKTIGAMTEADLKAFVEKCLGDMQKSAKETEAQDTKHAEATKALSEEIAKLKNLQGIASKRVGELEKQLADLSGEQPRVNTQVYRATQDPATVRKEVQTTTNLGPQADPNFLKFLTGAGAQ